MSLSANLATKKHRLLVLGSGWAGFRLIQGIDTKRFDVTVVSPRNHFTFTPLLASSAVGTLEFRCVTEPVKRVPQIQFFEATCDGVDLVNKNIACTSALEGYKDDKFILPYDSLVIATGAVSNTFNIPGVKEHALFLKDVSDARKIRSRIMECFEHASQPNVSESERSKLLHFAVVGGGPTGVEFMAELHDFITEDILKLYPSLRPHVSMTIYDVGKKILGAFDDKLSQYARKTFTRKGITLKLGEGVKQVEKTHFILQGGGKVDYGLLVWSTGLSPVSLVKQLTDAGVDGKVASAARDSSMGRLLTDEHFRVLDGGLKPLDSVYALGDCATIKERHLPCTAQVANQKALNKMIKANATTFESIGVKPFEYNHMGSLAYVGKWRAIVDMKSPTAPPPSKDGKTDGNGTVAAIQQFVPNTGISAWLFWRSAYFTMSVSLKNKVMIPMFWFLTWIFGRDITRFH
ncbi:UNVERIFIED_CONTAM: hypothetical protein HDU68_010682 [Siphonaria sp. JEL0065]|nr:hypothetical protein HDU68_010682 [Siphonaria sp. JEL0065]